MTEQLSQELKGFKVWLSLDARAGARYMGEFHAPQGQCFFFPKDLKALGLGPGKYLVLAPDSGHYRVRFERWQTVVVPE
jgi:hypothetical protein